MESRIDRHMISACEHKKFHLSCLTRNVNHQKASTFICSNPRRILRVWRIMLMVRPLRQWILFLMLPVSDVNCRTSTVRNCSTLISKTSSWIFGSPFSDVNNYSWKTRIYVIIIKAKFTKARYSEIFVGYLHSIELFGFASRRINSTGNIIIAFTLRRCLMQYIH